MCLVMTSHRLEQCPIDAVQAFYRWEDITQFTLGKQDIVTIWDENCDKHKEQNRKMTIGKAYSFLMKVLVLPLGKVNLQN